MQPLAFLGSELFTFRVAALFVKHAFSKSTSWVRQMSDENHRWPLHPSSLLLPRTHIQMCSKRSWRNINNQKSLSETTLDVANSSLSSALTFYPTIVFSRLCCLRWTISDVLIAAVGTNYCMQIWARCHFWAASCQLVVSLLKRHFSVSESACDENLWLELRSCFLGLVFLSKMRALMRALFLGFRRNIF